MAKLDLAPETIRQRRNLMITALLLIFIDLADVQFGREIVFLGATLRIGNPEVIHGGIWAILAYFLWRFYQYFSSDDAYSALLKQYRESIDGEMTKRIVHLVCRSRGHSGLMGEYSYRDLKSDGFLRYVVSAKVSNGYDPSKGGPTYSEFEAEISAIRLEIARLVASVGFAFRARILTDYFVPYCLVVSAVVLQFV